MQPTARQNRVDSSVGIAVKIQKTKTKTKKHLRNESRRIKNANGAEILRKQSDINQRSSRSHKSAAAGR